MASPGSTGTESLGDSSNNLASTDTSGASGSGLTSPTPAGLLGTSLLQNVSPSPPGAPGLPIGTASAHIMNSPTFFQNQLADFESWKSPNLLKYCGTETKALPIGKFDLLTSTPATNIGNGTPASPPSLMMAAGDSTIKCPLCVEPYQEPKVLACFHSFCKKCLHRLLDSPEKIICPQCHAETQLCAEMGIDSLLHDYGLDNQQQKQLEEKGQTPGMVFGSPSSSSSPGLGDNNSQTSNGSDTIPNCTGCKSKESTAAAYCQDCCNFLCPNCVMAHQYMHCFEGHRVQDISEMDKKSVGVLAQATGDKPVKCFQHRAEVLRYFCFTCNIPVCKECVATDHQRGVHKCEAIQDVAEKQIELVEHLLVEASEKQGQLMHSFKCVGGMNQRLNLTYGKAQQDIEETVRFLTQTLNEQRQLALKELETQYTNKQMQFQMTEQKLQQMTEKLTQTILFTGRLLKYANTAEILVFKQLLETRLQVILSYQPEMTLANQCELEFNPANQHAARSAISNAFGFVKSMSGHPIVDGPIRSAPVSLAPAPIGRPSSRSSGSRHSSGISPNSMPLPIGSNLLNGTAAATAHAYSDSNLLQPKHDLGGSSQSLGTFSVMSEPQGPTITASSYPYTKWSSGGPDTYAPGSQPPMSIMPPIADVPVVTDPYGLSPNSLVQAVDGPLPDRMHSTLFPPRSQIKRQKMIYHCKFGEFGVMEGQFTEPSGVAVNAQNDVIVADTNNHRIQVFDKEGRFKFQFGECGKRDGQLLYPNRVAVNRQTGDIIVTERSPTHQIQVYNQYGQFLRKFGANILQHPRGVTVDCRGRIVVIECKVMRVLIFDMYGNVLQKFSCSRYLEFPNGVCANDKQEIFISDNRAHCIKVFNYDGQFLRQIGGEGITNYPIGVGINHLGEVVVADNHNNFNLTIFQQDGTLVNALESKVKHAQCFDVSLLDEGSVVLASKDYRLYLYRYMQLPQFPG